MRKKVFGRKLGRERDTRRALFRSLIRAFVLYGKISTTKAKAKAVQPDIEKVVNLAKGTTISNLRQLHSVLGNDTGTVKLLGNATKAFKDKKSGYTRIINLERRTGDNAEMVRLEWSEKVESNKGQVTSNKKNKTKKSKAVEAKVLNEKPKKKTLKERLTSLRKRK